MLLLLNAKDEIIQHHFSGSKCDESLSSQAIFSSHFVLRGKITVSASNLGREIGKRSGTRFLISVLIEVIQSILSGHKNQSSFLYTTLNLQLLFQPIALCN